MAVKLRLKRMGKKRQPIYKIVAADSRSPRDGKFLEAIGLYNPLTDPASVDLNEERALYWLGVGAQPTDTVKNILSSEGILLKKELEKRKLSSDQVDAKVDEWRKAKDAQEEAKRKKKENKKSAKAIAKEKEVSTKEETSSKPTEEASSSDSAEEVKGATSE